MSERRELTIVTGALALTGVPSRCRCRTRHETMVRQ